MLIWYPFCLFVILFNGVSLLENGVARTPPMGWMSWGYYMCAADCVMKPDKCLDEKLILSVADALYDEGYQEAGFEYIIIDDCWSEMGRDENGRLVPDRDRFPRGMKYLADYIHARGLKFGMYTNIAQDTCMRYPGSMNHFMVDSKTFASWDVDYIKVDGCFVTEEYLNRAYIKLGHYLNETGRPMVYSCSWPFYSEFIHNKKFNFSNVVPVCNMWRNYHDVFLNWGSVRGIIQHFQDNYDTLHKYHGPGHWNDPDMLVFGTDSLTPGQYRIQLSVYAMMSAPLLLSCDMKRLTPLEKKLLLNQDLMAIAQDPLGIMAKPHTNDVVTLWVKPHLPRKGDIYPSYSFALVNMEDTSHTVSFTPADFGLTSQDGYTVMDVLEQKFTRNVSLSDKIVVLVPAVDVVLYTLFPL